MPTAPNTVLIHAGPVFSYKHTNTTLMLTLTPENWCDSMTKLCVQNVYERRFTEYSSDNCLFLKHFLSELICIGKVFSCFITLSQR